MKDQDIQKLKQKGHTPKVFRGPKRGWCLAYAHEKPVKIKSPKPEKKKIEKVVLNVHVPLENLDKVEMPVKQTRNVPVPKIEMIVTQTEFEIKKESPKIEIKDEKPEIKKPNPLKKYAIRNEI